MSKSDAIKSYLDYLDGKGSFILHGPQGMGKEPSAEDYDLGDELERELYESDKDHQPDGADPGRGSHTV